MRARIGINTGRVLVGTWQPRPHRLFGDRRPGKYREPSRSAQEGLRTEIMLGQGTVEEAGAHLVVRSSTSAFAVYGVRVGSRFTNCSACASLRIQLGTALGKPLTSKVSMHSAKRLDDLATFERCVALRGGTDGCVGAPDRKSQRVQGDPAAIGFGRSGRYEQLNRLANQVFVAFSGPWRGRVSSGLVSRLFDDSHCRRSPIVSIPVPKRSASAPTSCASTSRAEDVTRWC